MQTPNSQIPRDNLWDGDSSRKDFYRLVGEIQEKFRTVVGGGGAKPGNYEHKIAGGREPFEQVEVTSRHTFAAYCEEAKVAPLPLPLEFKGIGRQAQGHVILDNYGMGSKLAMALATSMPFSDVPITTFSAVGNGIDDEVGGELISALAARVGEVVAVDLSHNRLGDKSTPYTYFGTKGLGFERGLKAITSLREYLLNTKHGIKVNKPPDYQHPYSAES